jgi:hypothetical protein
VASLALGRVFGQRSIAPGTQVEAALGSAGGGPEPGCVVQPFGRVLADGLQHHQPRLSRSGVGLADQARTGGVPDRRRLHSWVRWARGLGSGTKGRQAWVSVPVMRLQNRTILDVRPCIPRSGFTPPTGPVLRTPETLRTQARTSSHLAEEPEHALGQQGGRLVVVLGEIVLGARIDQELRSGHGCGQPLRDLEVLVALQ